MSTFDLPPVTPSRGPNSRSKLACKQCRDRHVKCDQQHPCGLCRRRNVECSYGDTTLFTPVEWVPETTSAVVPSELQGRGARAKAVKFVDETSNVSQLYRVLPYVVTDTSATSAFHQSITPSFHTIPIVEPGEAFYMSRYTEVIGPWFDMFDTAHRFFSTVVPHLALGNRLLLHSCLADAARQHFLVTYSRRQAYRASSVGETTDGTVQDNHRGHDDALAYYNEALRLLYERLNDSGHEAVTFASCLLIAHCEMIESKDSDWNVHLKGTKELVTIHGWNGASGGLAQASFWIYCRMMILASISSGTPTPLNSKQWLPGGSFMDPVECTLDIWSKKVVYLLGSVHNFWCTTRGFDSPDSLDRATEEWNNLRAQLLQHQSHAPVMCHPLTVLSAGQDGAHPYQAVRYLNGSVAAAWQMLHTAFLISTFSAPCLPTSRLPMLSSPDVSHTALSYARHIVSNSITNRCSIAWANAVQLLTIAGQCIVEREERKACVRILEDIQAHTGWNTQANVQRLMSAWSWEGAQGGWGHPERGGPTEENDLGILLFKIWRGDVDTAQSDHRNFDRLS